MVDFSTVTWDLRNNVMLQIRLAMRLYRRYFNSNRSGNFNIPEVFFGGNFPKVNYSYKRTYLCCFQYILLERYSMHTSQKCFSRGKCGLSRENEISELDLVLNSIIGHKLYPESTREMHLILFGSHW